MILVDGMFLHDHMVGERVSGERIHVTNEHINPETEFDSYVVPAVGGDGQVRGRQVVNNAVSGAVPPAEYEDYVHLNDKIDLRAMARVRGADRVDVGVHWIVTFTIS